MHTHKHRICFHKSPVIPLLRTPEKVRQLPPISKRLKENVLVNEYVHVHVRVCVQTAVWKDAAHLQFVWFLIPHVFLKLSDFTKSFIHPPSQTRALSTCTGLRVLLACLRLLHGTLMHFKQLEEHVWTDTCTLNQPGSTVFAVSVTSPHPVTYKEPIIVVYCFLRGSYSNL